MEEKMAKTTKKKAGRPPKKELKRARNEKGHYIADDPTTSHNEAYGESPWSLDNIKKNWKMVLLGIVIILVLIVGNM